MGTLPIANSGTNVQKKETKFFGGAKMYTDILQTIPIKLVVLNLIKLISATGVAMRHLFLL